MIDKIFNNSDDIEEEVNENRKRINEVEKWENDLESDMQKIREQYLDISDVEDSEE